METASKEEKLEENEVGQQLLHHLTGHKKTSSISSCFSCMGQKGYCYSKVSYKFLLPGLHTAGIAA